MSGFFNALKISRHFNASKWVFKRSNKSTHTYILLDALKHPLRAPPPPGDRLRGRPVWPARRGPARILRARRRGPRLRPGEVRGPRQGLASRSSDSTWLCSLRGLSINWVHFETILDIFEYFCKLWLSGGRNRILLEKQFVKAVSMCQFSIFDENPTPKIK